MGKGPSVFNYSCCLAPSSKQPRGRLRDFFYSHPKGVREYGARWNTEAVSKSQGLLIEAKEGLKLLQHLFRPETLQTSQSHQDCLSHAVEGRSSPWGLQVNVCVEEGVLLPPHTRLRGRGERALTAKSPAHHRQIKFTQLHRGNEGVWTFRSFPPEGAIGPSAPCRGE